MWVALGIQDQMDSLAVQATQDHLAMLVVLGIQAVLGIWDQLDMLGQVVILGQWVT